MLLIDIGSSLSSRACRATAADGCALCSVNGRAAAAAAGFIGATGGAGHEAAKWASACLQATATVGATVGAAVGAAGKTTDGRGRGTSHEAAAAHWPTACREAATTGGAASSQEGASRPAIGSPAESLSERAAGGSIGTRLSRWKRRERLVNNAKKSANAANSDVRVDRHGTLGYRARGSVPSVCTSDKQVAEHCPGRACHLVSTPMLLNIATEPSNATAAAQLRRTVAAAFIPRHGGGSSDRSVQQQTHVSECAQPRNMDSRGRSMWR